MNIEANKIAIGKASIQFLTRAARRAFAFSGPAAIMAELNSKYGSDEIVAPKFCQDARKDGHEKLVNEMSVTHAHEKEKSLHTCATTEHAADIRRDNEILTQIFANTGANISRVTFFPAYSTSNFTSGTDAERRACDLLFLPPAEAYESVDQMRVIETHEFMHWTNHPDRINRPRLDKIHHASEIMGQTEELVAESACYGLLSLVAPDTAERCGERMELRAGGAIARLAQACEFAATIQETRDIKNSLERLMALAKLVSRDTVAPMPETWAFKPKAAQAFTKAIEGAASAGAEAAMYLYSPK